MSTLGERLKGARERKGWSQTFVCKKLHIPNTTLSGYERNYREPDADTLARLAELYEVTTDYLIVGHIKEKHTHPEGTVVELTRNEHRFIHATETIGASADQNPLGIELSPEQLETLRDVMLDKDTLLMFRDFANSTEEERRTMLDVWAAIRKRSKLEE